VANGGDSVNTELSGRVWLKRSLAGNSGWKQDRQGEQLPAKINGEKDQWPEKLLARKTTAKTAGKTTGKTG
jgi:hypothetical protein